MKAIGVNIYGGGFGVGVRRGGANMLGTVETWKPGKLLAGLLGIKQLDGPVPADLVIMNPPCSRFSTMSLQSYSTESRQNLCLFQELVDGFDIAREAGAGIIWWENGPVAFTSGWKIINEAHRYTRAKTTLVMKIDPTYLGLVQLRPRTHVIHFMDRVDINTLLSREVAQASLGEWICSRVVGLDLKPAPDLRYFQVDDPVSAIRKLDGLKLFNSCKPATVRETQRYSYAVLSSRQFAWEGQNRWWSVPEYAAAMTYPPAADYGSLNLPIYKLLPLLAKSVMPELIQRIYTDVIVQLINGNSRLGDREVDGDRDVQSRKVDDIFYVRMLSKYHARDEYSD